MFHDRHEAADRLAAALQHLQPRHPLVLAIPRGGVPIGVVLAERLGGDLDIVLVRKLRAPGRPEVAVGAIDEQGKAYVAPHALAAGASGPYLEEEKRSQLLEIGRRRGIYTPGRPPVAIAGRTVSVVDDGLATGATMLASLDAVRQAGPAWLVCAVPVASPEGLELMRAHADEVVCLAVPERFAAVSPFYASFPQVSDVEVIALLNRSTAPAG